MPTPGIATSGTILVSTIQQTVQPTDAVLTYSGDQLDTYTDTNGSKSFFYDGFGKLTSIVGTGIYKTKTFGYNGSDQLTTINIT